MIECFFDCSSPWTYLAFHNLQVMADELHEPVLWRPILVGGIFNSINPSVYAQREKPVPAKAAYLHKDLQDWARLAQLRIVFPPRIFPINSVKVMRGCLWLQPQGLLLPFARAAFEAYWARQEDIADDAVLAALCRQCGVDPAALLQAIAGENIKQQLKDNTTEVIDRGGFGSPTMFLGDDMFFGNDRLPLLREAVLLKRRKRPGLT
ncbi:MAG: 2-hydroxychromene-2-carboxylate isomerase [Rhodoferax sp.]|nr:2-hydroxychromene-2-carboxylate isomerase [Rhodoferax sp.]